MKSDRFVAVGCETAGWPRRGFERLGDGGARGLADSRSILRASCCSATRSLRAGSGPPRQTDTGGFLRILGLPLRVPGRVRPRGY